MTSIAFYVSGHGYGHATRVEEVIRQLSRLTDKLRCCVRTSAPPNVFEADVAQRRHVEHVEIDAGVVEDDVLHVNGEATLDAAEALLRKRPDITRREAAFVRDEGIGLVIADVPWMAGYVAEAAGVPCVALANFTWDWIYEPYVADTGRGESVLRAVREGYAKMDCVLRLPLSAPMSAFKGAVDVPLVARRSELEPAEVHCRLGIEEPNARAMILVALRGGTQPHQLARVAACMSDCVFVTIGPSPPGCPRNVYAAGLGQGVRFVDLVRAADVVISKLGYSTAAECIAHETAVVFPTRYGFREDSFLPAAVAQHTRAVEMGIEAFRRGEWSDAIERVLALPVPRVSVGLDGARVCAERIVSMSNRLDVAGVDLGRHRFGDKIN